MGLEVGDGRERVENNHQRIKSSKGQVVRIFREQH